tara:strand:+ start:157 stop:393 length:237 start_codon:yes stop_codon:yes gene_type:complete
MTKVNINGKEYELESLPQAAQDHVSSWRYTEVEIQKTQLLLAALQTAKNAYSVAIANELEIETTENPEVNIPDNLTFD